MKVRLATRAVVVAIAAAFPLAAFAAGDKPMAPPAGSATSQPPPMTPAADTLPHSDRAQMERWSNDKENLETALKAAAKDRSYYRQELERRGYRITAVNRDTPTELEYEVVKGNNTYEVQIDFERNSKLASKVDVASNLWKADSTETALKDANYRYEYPTTVGPEAAAYSDRTRMKGWTSEKDALQKSLLVGQSKDYYRAELTKRGYQITSVNDAKSDYVEYEVVKGQNSYEVQIDFDRASGKATKVDVTTNLWEHEATDRALDQKQARTKQ